jgi:tetratricopeptide (TPR) repeat protein
MQDCPGHEELQAFLSGALAEARAALLRAHVLDCVRCQDLLDRLTDSETLSPWKPLARQVRSELEPEPALESLRQVLRTVPGESTLEGSTDWRAVLGPSSRPGDLGTLDGYFVEAELGRGGMGIVFRAFDPGLQRRVALKVLRPDLTHPRARRRLVREARVVAQFRHDHLVAVYAVVDPTEGLPYLVMEYLDGPTLSHLIGLGTSLEPRQAANLAAQVADGLAAAHAAGLVHRDIKPDNIMIDPATGRAKLMDFGLARDEASQENLTREDVLAGTPTHMSPEQARGLELDGRSDVYSLGVTLYECLTGEVPFRGAPHMVLQQVCDDEPRPPGRLNDRIPRDLETICLKAMAKEPSRRYATARDLADDLRRWLNGEPIKARPPGPVGRLARWCRRNPRLAVLVVIVFGLLVLLTAVSSLATLRIAREQRQTLQEHKAASDHYHLALETLNSLVLDLNQKLGSRPGTLQVKRDILETARAGLEKIARSNEAAGTIDRSAVVAYDQLGWVFNELGRTSDAIHAYDKARDLAEALARANPDSLESQRDLAGAHDKLGDMSRFNNDIPAAEAAFRRAVAVREALTARHGQDPEVLRDQQVSTNKIGLIHLRRGEYAAALAQFTRALELLDRYAPNYPSRTKVLSDYEYTYRQLGQACLMSDWTAGAEYSRKALESARAFVAAAPQDLWLRKKLAIDYDQLAAARLLLADLDGAEANYLESQKVRQALLDAESGDVDNRRSLAVSYRYLGDLARCRRNTDATRSLYQKCLAICETLADADPGSAQKQGDVLETLGVLTDNAERAEKFDEALEWIQRTMHWLDRLEREKRLRRDVLEPSRLIATGQQALYQAAARGPGLDSAPTPELPPVLQDWWRLLHGLGLARRGRYVEAAAEIRDVLSRDPKESLKSIRVARVFARCAESVAPGKPDMALTAEERTLRQDYIHLALDAVRRTLQLSPATAFDTFAEPDLDLLRRRGDLQAIARELGQEVSRKAKTP